MNSRRRTHLVAKFLCALCVLCGEVSFAAEPQPWSTYRGNAQRTGNTDAVAGPAAPKVLWTHKSMEHFVASPVVVGDRLYLSGLGAFNVSNFYCLSADPKAAKRDLWIKTTPYLKLPTVSSPVVADGKLIFGDGMHQTTGQAFLHCLQQEKGLPLWRLDVKGELVHLEGTPTVVDGKVYIGGGEAGVVCVHLEKATLDKKEIALAEVQKLLEKRWKELQAKYEEDKKKDPDFAVPPNEDMLPRPEPVLVWQQGKGRWHVDAPVAVAGDKVFVGSAFLDKEKVGDRALFCLDAATGKEVWKAALKLNPWGGPSLAGDVAIVTGSTIGYDTAALKGAKGSITAIDLATGQPKWHKEVPGGIVSCAAIADGKAIVTATDGKVRAYDLANGNLRWYYGDAKNAFFAPPAVAAGVVYAGDLHGVVHAIDLGDGKAKWTFDLGADPDVKAPGMIYGGPAVHGGRIYVATCNLEGPNARQGTAIVCIGNK